MQACGSQLSTGHQDIHCLPHCTLCCAQDLRQYSDYVEIKNRQFVVQSFNAVMALVQQAN